jgi:hypothetical protein
MPIRSLCLFLLGSMIVELQAEDDADQAQERTRDNQAELGLARHIGHRSQSDDKRHLASLLPVRAA